MSTVSEKLSLIFDTKQLIKQAINSKGGNVSDTTPFTDYPAAIHGLSIYNPTAPAYKWNYNPTWWDLKQVLAEDVAPDGYVAVAAFLLTNISTQTTLEGFNAYKTSDGNLYTAKTVHIWDTTKDKECDEGYYTRYIIAYVKTTADWYGKLLLNSKGSTITGKIGFKGQIGVVFDSYVYLSMKDPTNMTIFKYSASKTSGYVNKYSFAIVYGDALQFIDVTYRCKLAVNTSWLFSSKQYFPALRYLAPLWVISTIWDEIVPDWSAMSYPYNQFECLYLAKTSSAPSKPDECDSNSMLLPPNLNAIELHIPNAYHGYYATDANGFPTSETYGVNIYLPAFDNSQTYSVPRQLHIYIEEDKTDINHIYTGSSSYKTFKHANTIYVLLKTSSSVSGGYEYSTYFIQPVTKFKVIDNTAATPYVLNTTYGWYFMGCSDADIANIFGHLQDRTGLTTQTLLVSESMLERMSSTLKAEIANKNWTISASWKR